MRGHLHETAARHTIGMIKLSVVPDHIHTVVQTISTNDERMTCVASAEGSIVTRAVPTITLISLSVLMWKFLEVQGNSITVSLKQVQ